MPASARPVPTTAASRSAVGWYHFPYLPIVTNPEKQLLYPGDPDRHQNLIILSTGPLSIFFENFMQIRLEVFELIPTVKMETRHPVA